MHKPLNVYAQINQKSYAMFMQQAKNDLACCRSFDEMRQFLLDLMNSNDYWRRKQCINLVAAEAPMSEVARSLLAFDVSTRTASGYIGEGNRYFHATQYIDQIEAICHTLLNELFICKFCDHRLLGGTQAAQIVYATFTKPKNTIIAVLPQHGGDSSNTIASLPGLLKLTVIPMPFLSDHVTIDLEKLEKLAIAHRPHMISIGFSVLLFQPPLAAISAIANKVNALVYYDAAHELGLIAGQNFENPFKHQIDIVSGSTGKTFSGPQGGLLLWNNSSFTDRLLTMVFPAFVGTYQLNRVMALALTALELHKFGQVYMQQVVKNAQALATYLDELKIPIFAKQHNFTLTHQIILNAENYGGGFHAAKQLAACNIVTNHVGIPGDCSANNPAVRGVRLATTEVTRRGMKEGQMQNIAQFIYRAFIKKESCESIAKEVSKFMHDFPEIVYC